MSEQLCINPNPDKWHSECTSHKFPSFCWFPPTTSFSLRSLLAPTQHDPFLPSSLLSSPHVHSLCSHVSPSGSKSTLRQRRKPLLAVQMSKPFSNPVQLLASITSLATSSLG